MRVIKRSQRSHPRVSLCLVDWGVRESFHLLHYLKNQTVPRDTFEVVLVEYYGVVSPAAKRFESEIDTWVLLEMPADCYYHKHLMYNAGVVFSNGELLMFMDSDAMVGPTFVPAILRAFERDPSIVYHMDEFRNVRRDFYPFNYPSFEDVLGEGCINNEGGKTKGVLDEIDPMHTRNSGAGMCARRSDVIAIGGADEDLTYLGHICGPYEMAFRLMNSGRRLVWETEEYLYHTWHPGSDGVDNYLGPHDGRNFSTTALQALCSGRIPPLVENEAIRRLRTGRPISDMGTEVTDVLIDPDYPEAFDRTKLGGPSPTVAIPRRARPVFASYRGLDIFRLHGLFYAVTQDSGPPDLESSQGRADEPLFSGRTFQEVYDAIDAVDARLLETVGTYNICQMGQRFAVVPHELGGIDFRIRSQRENPGITWSASFAEARRIANRGDLSAPQRAEGQIHQAPAPNHPASLHGGSAWRQYPFTATVVALVEQLGRLVEAAATQETVRFEHELQRLVGDTQRSPLFRALLARTVRECGRECLSRGDRQAADVCARALETLDDAPLIHGDVTQSDTLSGPTLAITRATIDDVGSDLPHLLGSVGPHNLVAFQGRTYAVPQWVGPVDLANPRERGQPGIIVGEHRGALEDFLRQGSTAPTLIVPGGEGTVPARSAPVGAGGRLLRFFHRMRGSRRPS
jgi:hypothetical protein